VVPFFLKTALQAEQDGSGCGSVGMEVLEPGRMPDYLSGMKPDASAPQAGFWDDRYSKDEFAQGTDASQVGLGTWVGDLAVCRCDGRASRGCREGEDGGETTEQDEQPAFHAESTVPAALAFPVAATQSQRQTTLAVAEGPE
jgi:hypothetical protein